jgi:16S rRNA (guanine1207-N2)-methyltransferase
MAETRNEHAVSDYRTWRQTSVNVAGRHYALATKPGVFAHGRVDPAAMLLAERGKVAEGDVVVHLNCGNGLFGSVAASVASRVVLTDRNVIGVEAARRTVVANGAKGVEVVLGHGAYALPKGLEADVVAIRIPHEKLALLQLFLDAFRILKIGGRCYIAGATNEGIKAATSTMERLFGNAGALAIDSGNRLVVATKRTESPASTEGLDSPYLSADVFNRIDATLRERAFTLYSRPGVFSWDHLDEATEILAAAMEIGPGDSVLDLGCGYGALGVVAATLSGNGDVTMVDADVEAVRSATRSAAEAGVTNVRLATSDVGSAVMGDRFDVVVTNPPFHIGKSTDLHVPLQFIYDAWEVMAPEGRLFLVANRTLPYERNIKHRFGNIRTVHDGPRFKVLSATR